MATLAEKSEQNWFDQGGESYARYRPDYPDELARYLAGLAPDHQLAVDVGCGNGQFTRQLAAHFEAVVGVDPSASQLASAARHERVRYERAPAERLPVADATAGLITSAQAAHWFDLPRFYAEVRRVARPGAFLALVTYATPEVEPALKDRFDAFYEAEIGPYWPPERVFVDSGYAAMDFPFPERAAPPLAIRREWNAAEFLGYISTWSAIRRAREAGREDLLQAFAEDVLRLWGDPERRRAFSWAIRLRLGEVG